MSRLQAPGFSRLKQPSSFTVNQREKQEEAGVFKRPQSLPVVNKPLSSSKSDVPHVYQKTSSSTSQKKIPATPPTSQHGQSPYERNKPTGHQIPYVGKKRAIGVLKAPVSRTAYNQPLNNQNESKLMQQNKARPKQVGSPNKIAPSFKKPTSHPSSISQSKQNNNSIQKSIERPIRRQLIPDSSVKSITRPKSSASTTKPLSGLVQPRSFSRGSNKIGTTNANISGGRGLSRSLQTLPQVRKNISQQQCKELPTKSVSQFDLRGPSTNDNAFQLKIKATAKFGFGSGLQRPRASSNKLNSTAVNISTPCQPANKYRDEIKISPIISDNDVNNMLEISNNGSILPPPNHILEVTHNASVTCDDTAFKDGSILSNSYDNAKNKEQNAADISSPEFDTPDEESDKNKSELLGQTNLDEDCMYQQNQTEYFNQTHVIQNSAINATVNLTQDIAENATVNLTQNNALNATVNLMQANAVNETFPLDQMNKTQVIETLGNQTEIISKSFNATQSSDYQTEVDESDNLDFLENTSLNKTQVIDKISLVDQIKTLTESLDQNLNFTHTPNAFNESDYIENVEMPLYENTPYKGESLYDELQHDESFTQDIKTVIAAISSSHNTQLYHDPLIVTSPIKTPNHVVPSNCITSHVENPSDFNQDDDTTDLKGDDGGFAVVDLPRSVSLIDEPETPTKDDQEFEFDLGSRCHTISLGTIARAEERYSKVRRHNTLGSQDLMRKFRIHKHMNTVETLEGNILMDNTTFLQFSNDVKAMKTQLLKLKRTLLEADCFSPLVKDALMRTPVSSATHDVNPPLSPRPPHTSPLAIVDPLVMMEVQNNNNEKEVHNDISTLTNKFTQALQRIEELEKTAECDKYTIKLLQTQLENYEQKELDILEENIILREQNGILTEKLQVINLNPANSGRERKISGASSYDEYDMGDSRKNILQRLYSNETSD